MPSLSGFSDNPFRTRGDFVRATLAFLKPLHPCFSPGHARVKLPVAAGAHFDDGAAQLEGFARPLWAVGALLAGLSASSVHEPGSPTAADVNTVLDPWIRGIATGTDPNHPEYWGDVGALDQRMVEAEIISFALLAAPERMYKPLTPEQQANVATWLRSLQGKPMPENNWRWFRVFANLALVQVCGVPEEELREHIDSDLDLLDTYYMEAGWSSDGPWLTSEEMEEEHARESAPGGRRDLTTSRRQADYYSGSFAIQFSQLLYTRFAADFDPARVERYRQRARDFGTSFWRYFDSEGAAIPFGRSLTYRFACGGYFAALAVAQVPDMPEPLSTPGAIKGHLLRHLRWWANHSENIFYPDGTMNLGWLYPNTYLCEDYNSPQSVYWCLKTLIAVALPAEDPFWTAEESPYPKDSLSGVAAIPPPRQILCNHPGSNHHFLLSGGQLVAWPLRSGHAKYAKFAYSSAFGFSVPTGPLIPQLAPDNTLALSRDRAETWAAKGRFCQNPDMGSHASVISAGVTSTLPVARVRWYPWGDRSVVVDTTLLPPADRWPDWHVRVHKMRRSADYRPGEVLYTVEGGFAILGRTGADEKRLKHLDAFPGDAQLGSTEGIIKGDQSAIVLSAAGASGIVFLGDVPGAAKVKLSAEVLEPNSNTNLMHRRTVIPTISGDIADFKEGSEVVLVTLVFAISTEANGRRGISGKSLKERWFDRPRVIVGGPLGDSDAIRID